MKAATNAIFELATDLGAAAQRRAAALTRHLPPGIQITPPEGGYFLWLELPENHDAIEIHRRALDQGFSIAPGPIFSARRAFRHCLRLNYGHPWNPSAENALRALGKLLRQPVLFRRQVSEHAHHGIHASDVDTRISGRHSAARPRNGNHGGRRVAGAGATER